MKTKYEVIDSPFNRKNYSDMVGKVFDEPPAYANVRLIKEKVPMADIYKNQSKMFMENNVDTMAADFVIKCIREGYDKEEVVEGLAQFYHQAPESGIGIFDRTLIKYLGIEDPTKKTAKFNLKEFILRK